MRRLPQPAVPRCLGRPACPDPAGALPLDAGVDGFNRWSFSNRGDLDGQGQFIETWDPTANRLLAQSTPHPNTYSCPAGLRSRFKAKRSAVLDTGFRYPLSVSEIMGAWFFVYGFVQDQVGCGPNENVTGCGGFGPKVLGVDVTQARRQEPFWTHRRRRPTRLPDMRFDASVDVTDARKHDAFGRVGARIDHLNARLPLSSV